jgi:hypothetical protein
MTKDLINTALLTLAVCLGMAACSGIFVSKARSEGLETAIAVCRKNPKCTDGALVSESACPLRMDDDCGLARD